MTRRSGALGPRVATLRGWVNTLDESVGSAKVADQPEVNFGGQIMVNKGKS